MFLSRMGFESLKLIMLQLISNLTLQCDTQSQLLLLSQFYCPTLQHPCPTKMHVTVLQHKLQSTSSVTSQYPSFSTRSRSSTRHKVESVYEVMNFQDIQGRKVETEVITQTQFVPFLRDKCQKIQHRTSTKHETLLGLRSIMYKANVL